MVAASFIYPPLFILVRRLYTMIPLSDYQAFSLLRLSAGGRPLERSANEQSLTVPLLVWRVAEQYIDGRWGARHMGGQLIDRRLAVL